MTVRTAELVFAILLTLCSIGLMVKSAELNIGWVKDKGPGSGAWPFWLSTGMLLSCLWTLWRWIKEVTPESRSQEPYMSRQTTIVVGTSAGAILLLLVLTQFAGIYVALPIFLLLYLKVVGHHSWPLSITLAICIPVFIFSLFEWALQIPLPKAFTEEWFYPMYDLMYAQSAGDALAAFKAPIVSIPALATLLCIGYWVLRWVRRDRRAASDV